MDARLADLANRDTLSHMLLPFAKLCQCLVFACVIAIVSGRSLTAQSAAETADSELLRLVRTLVTDSVRGGGVRDGQLYAGRDSLSIALMRAAGIALDSSGAVGVCPGSTDSSNQQVPPPFGYSVIITLRPGSDSTTRALGVGKSCSFFYQGAKRGFAEMSTWEIRRTGAGWRIVRRLSWFIT
jgi:hypothetical protein